VSWLYLGFFTQGLPFYFEDLDWIRDNSPLWAHVARMLNPFRQTEQLGLFDRPFEHVCLRSIRACFDFSPWPYHAFKNAACVAVVLLVYTLLRRATVGSAWALAGSLGITLAAPVLQSVAWVCDFEIVAQALVCATIVVFLADVRRLRAGAPSSPWARLTIVVLTLLGSATKASAAILPVLLAAFLLLRLRSRARGYADAFVATALITAGPALGSHGPLPHGWLAGQTLVFARELLTVWGWPLIAAVVVTSGALLIGRLDLRRLPEALVDTVVLTGTWAALNLLLLGLVPSAETRYLTSAIVAATAFGTAVTSAAVRLFPLSARRLGSTALVLAVCWQGAYNANLSLHFRGFWGSLFIAADKAVRLVDERYSGAVVLYSYWRPLLYSPQDRNRYVLMRPADMASVGVTVDASGRLTFAGRQPSASLLVSLEEADERAIATVDGDGHTLYDAVSTTFDLRFVDIGHTLQLGPRVPPAQIGIYRTDQR
jgi:hypothetical protein